MKIFGYTWEQIQKAQRGAPLLSTPTTGMLRLCTQEDVNLLVNYGPQKLRDMGYYGVIDRLQRAGLM